MVSMNNTEITYTDGAHGANYIGVWVKGKPAGRLRHKDGEWRAFTNLREPGKAFLGAFATQDEAGERVAQEHRQHSRFAVR